MTSSGGRIAFWDNAKWLAMALVVIGHAVQPLALESDASLVVYLLIYAFHMPLFGVVSGYFTTAEPTAKHFGRVISDLLVPYVIFETIWTVVNWLIGGHRALDYSSASWTLWFLLALAFFRIALPVIARLRWPLLWVVVLAVVVGYWDGVDQSFSVARAIGMLPFFTLGWQLRGWGVMDRWFARDSVVGFRVAALGVFAAAIALLALFADTWRDTRARFWFFMDRGYNAMPDGEQWFDGGIRLGVMAITVVLIAAAFVLVPRRTTFFTAWGAATMYIYLLHTFVLFWPRESGWLRSLADHWWALPAAIVGALAVTVVLSLPFVRTLTSWLIEPRTAWLLKSNVSPRVTSG